MVVIIGPRGNGKSTLADEFVFVLTAYPAMWERLVMRTIGAAMISCVRKEARDPFVLRYIRETYDARPITYELTIGKDESRRPYVKEKRLIQRCLGRKKMLAFLIRVNLVLSHFAQ